MLRGDVLLLAILVCHAAVLYPSGLLAASAATQVASIDDDTLIVLYSSTMLVWFGEYMLQTIETFAYGKRALVMCDIDNVAHTNRIANATRFAIVLATDSWPLAPLTANHGSFMLQDLMLTAHSTQRLYLLWTEQMTRAFIRERFVKLAENFPQARILHYSDANKWRCAAAHPPSLQQVVPFYPLVDYYRKFWASEKLFDVCALGTTSNRRAVIVQQLTLAFNARFTEIRAFGEARDASVAQCRVLVNTHYHDDYLVLESMRVAAALASGVLVVSEHCVRSNLTELEKQHVVFSHSTEVAEVVADVLSEYTQRRLLLIDYLASVYPHSVQLPQPFLTLEPVVADW